MSDTANGLAILAVMIAIVASWFTLKDEADKGLAERLCSEANGVYIKKLDLCLDRNAVITLSK